MTTWSRHDINTITVFSRICQKLEIPRDLEAEVLEYYFEFPEIRENVYKLDANKYNTVESYLKFIKCIDEIKQGESPLSNYSTILKCIMFVIVVMIKI